MLHSFNILIEKLVLSIT